MRLMNVRWPRPALSYFLRQAIFLSPIQTRQQEIIMTVEDSATISAWNIANPATPCSLEIAESETFYLSGSITFWPLQVGDYVPPPNDDSRCNLICQPGWADFEVRNSFVTQINAYAKSMHIATDGYYDSLKAIPMTLPTNQLRILMPIGTEGFADSITMIGVGGYTAVYAGRTIPLAPGIIGPRRHIFGVHFPEPPPVGP